MFLASKLARISVKNNYQGASIKQVIAFLIILTAFIGCSKTPTEQNTNTNIGNITSIDFADTNGVEFGGWSNPGDTCFGIQMRFICDEQYYTDIDSCSDSLFAVLYTNTGKALNFDCITSYEYPTIISETLRQSIFYRRRLVYHSMDTANGYNILTLNDTLSHPDSVNVHIKWRSISTGQVYAKYKTFIDPKYSGTLVIY